MGIIGKTHGVKMAASPKPNASARNAPTPPPASAGTDAAEAAPGFASIYPAGIAIAEPANAPSSTLTAALISRVRGGMHCVPLQVWYLGWNASVASPGAASFF